MRGLAILAVIVSRIKAPAVVDLHDGDACIMRLTSERVAKDVLRSVILATPLMGVDDILVMPHTRFSIAHRQGSSSSCVIAEGPGVETCNLKSRTVMDQVSASRTDVTRSCSPPFLCDAAHVGGGHHHVESGQLKPIDA